MQRTGWLRLFALFAALGLFVAACSSDDSDDASSDDTTEVAGEDGDSGGESGSVLAAVQDRGELNCGVNDAGLPGFAVVDADGNWSGFDVSYCKAVAAAVLGDAEAVNYVPLTAETRFTALQAGDIDLLVRNTTWTASRDGTEGVTFLHSTFFDGQGMMVPADSGYTDIDSLDGASICVLTGTTTELNLATRAADAGITLTPAPFESNDELQPAYEAGQCEGWTSDKSQLTAFASEMATEQTIFEETFSKEPLGPVVLDGDSQWAQIVDWVTIATFQAEEWGITKDNVDGFASTTEDSNQLNWLGEEDPEEGTTFDPGLGLSSDANVQVIAAVGNYGEIYDEFIAPLGLTERGVNAQWSDGGLIYAPPYR